MIEPESPKKRRVLPLAPMPPEPAAYALARYSRSPEGIADSVRWVHEHSSEKFWEQFYFQYGHASIADLGHVVVCFEDVSELAAIHVEDEKLWDGQAKSSRYQDFSKTGYHVPDGLAPADEARYREAADELFAAYRELFPRVEAWVREENPRPDDMKEGAYRRTVQARAFDVVRYLLPLAVPTNVGQVTSIRTLEKQIGHLLAAPYGEVRSLGRELQESLAEPPLDLWGELDGRGVDPRPVAPTLARYAAPNEYWIGAYERLAAFAAERLPAGSSGEGTPLVDLLPDHDPEIEIVTTLLYRVTDRPYRAILDVVESWDEKRREEVVDLALEGRGREELLPEFQSGYRFCFDVLMDVGGWRDMHRHRRCQQVRQSFGFLHGYDVPPAFEAAGGAERYRRAMDAAAAAARALPSEAAAYLMPFGARLRCLFKMDYAEVEYVSRLRSGVKGHVSYRTVAWHMKTALATRYPALASRIDATPPEVEDSLTR